MCELLDRVPSDCDAAEWERRFGSLHGRLTLVENRVNELWNAVNPALTQPHSRRSSENTDDDNDYITEVEMFEYLSKSCVGPGPGLTPVFTSIGEARAAAARSTTTTSTAALANPPQTRGPDSCSQ